MAIFGNFKDNFATVFKKSLISILNIIDLIYGNLSNFKDNYDTATKTANKSMGFDTNAIILCCRPVFGQ